MRLAVFASGGGSNFGAILAAAAERAAERAAEGDGERLGAWLAAADFGPAAGDNGTGVAAAVALVRALDSGPPGHASVEVVLQGAGTTGLSKHLRKRRKQLSATNTVVLGLAASSGGELRWWLSDGSLVPLRYFTQLRQLCRQLADDEPHFNATPHRGRGAEVLGGQDREQGAGDDHDGPGQRQRPEDHRAGEVALLPAEHEVRRERGDGGEDEHRAQADRVRVARRALQVRRELRDERRRVPDLADHL